MVSNIGIWVWIVHFMIMITKTRLEHTSLEWYVVFHGLDHLIDPHDSEVGGGVYAILESIVVYSRCLFRSTVGNCIVCKVGCRVCTFCFVCSGRWCICLCCIWLWWGLSACLHIVCGVVGTMFCVAPVWSRSTFWSCRAHLYRNMVWPQNSGSSQIWFGYHLSFAARLIEGSR